MPAYNAEKYLREAIDSILAQTFTDFEFIIINDGSIDSTKEIIHSYEDSRIVYLENERNSGICVTLNKGLHAARGRYIARMDSDDISQPERFAKQVAYMDNHPEIGVLGTDIEVFGEGVKPYTFKQLHTPEECQAGLLFNSCFAHPSVMIRKCVLRDYKLQYNDDFRGLEDYELWWQIGKHSKLNNLPEALLRYRHHKGQETQNISPKVKRAFENFISVRINDLNVTLSSDDLKLLLYYSTGDYDNLVNENFRKFIIVLKKILTNFSSTRRHKLYQAVKLTLAKAITYTINQSSKQSNPQHLFNYAWIKGLFPTIWYLKVTYHNIRG